MNRRNFITTASLAACAPLVASSVTPKREECPSTFIKPIVGSWFQFEHHNQVGSKHWNAALPQFTTEQWKTVVREMWEIGMEYLVLLSVAYEGKTYYPSEIKPRHDFVCPDPMEAVLTAADELGVKFFISNDYWTDWDRVHHGMTDSEAWYLREKGMNEVVEKYGHHKSFYGWYYPHETELKEVFSQYAFDYTNRCSKIVRSLTPNALTMIAPYGTQYVKYNEKFIKQLDSLDIDIICYQDEVGVYKIEVGEVAQYFELLYKMHTKAGRSRLWADIEMFDFEAEVYHSPAIPAKFERVLEQMKCVSPYVEHTLCFQYQGFMNKPGTTAFAGLKEGTEKLYTDYMNWLNNIGWMNHRRK
ncbi:MAG: DUF4434 domain-containing protein [Dysgonamonadaceae bacterium]|jgi:hypothetical protein|nr:DUF4434 domain-containing protein [Dysgonamonadaceae bacterium]